MSDWIVWVPSALLAVAGVALAVVVRRLRAHTRDAIESAQADAAHLRHRLDELERRLERPARPTASEYVITDVVPTGSPSDPPGVGRHVAPPDGRIEGSLFADLVLRESVVKGVSLVHGVRRALAPQTRNRIRFEMRQEVRRSRKQRRIDLKEAKRHLADQQRAAEDAA